MRMSQMLIQTLREAPAEAETASHSLMLRAGLIRKLAAGIYAFLPMGYRVLKKIEGIVREEMDRAGAQELLMPALLPAEAYRMSGRWEVFGPEMFRLKDRGGRDFCLGPTHEEIFTETVMHATRSYRSLPVILYQIQSKYRDEIRPRFGVMRSREFVMKDAYSFDRDEAGLEASYRKMHAAYCKIFDRCGLDYSVVDADSGAMGGTGSQEFMVKSDIGEATIAYCGACGYAANDEKAECIPDLCFQENGDTGALFPERVATPDVKTMDELIRFFHCSPKEFAKTLIYKADKKLIAVMVRGDREVNEVKLQNHLRCLALEMADAAAVREVTGAEVGFAGPVGLKAEILMDRELAGMGSFITGANATGFHLLHVVPGRDFQAAAVLDVRKIVPGDACPECGSVMELSQGIEVGHIFKLGTKYSKDMGCAYLDEKGKEQPMQMGSYGIGIGRTMAAVIEQNNDADGIIWPAEIAPYPVVLVPVNALDPVQMETAERIYGELKAAGLDTVLDDRDERAGVKFKDADLLGIPVRITVGRKAGEGIVEYKRRNSSGIVECTVEEAVCKAIQDILKQ